MDNIYNIMFKDYPDILTIEDLVDMLGISRHSAYDLINSGEISAFHIGRLFKIAKVAVIDYVVKESNLSDNTTIWTGIDNYGNVVDANDELPNLHQEV